MIIPNLIEIVKNKEIDECVFKDLELNRILSNLDIQYLKYPCDKNEIQRRQSIFLSMEKEAFYDLLIQCYDSINNYERERDLMRKALNTLEKNCSIIHLLKAYVVLCESFEKMSRCCAATRRIEEYFSSIEKKEEIDSIKNSIFELSNVLFGILKCNLSFQTIDFIENNHNYPSYIDIIDRCTKVLQLDVEWKSSKSIPLDNALMTAMEHLYNEQFTLFGTIAENYQKQLNCDFSDIKSQIKFVLDIWELTQKAKSNNIPHSIPYISNNREIRIKDAYSISLIAKNTETPVPNDMFFDEEIPFYLVTGANGGGKTEYLRALGTNLILFLSGCPIFAKSAIIYPFTAIYTHFPLNDHFDNIGRFEDELNRTNQILQNADANSILLFNETFSGTDEEKGLTILLQTMEHLYEKHIFGLAVTHIHGIEKEKYAILCPEVIQMQDGNNRYTYRIVRNTFKSDSYAKDIIRKYKLDQASLLQRKAFIND